MKARAPLKDLNVKARTIVATLLVSALLAACAGASSQSHSTETPDAPSSGAPSPSTAPAGSLDALFVVAGQSLHLECRGDGGPAVILESGLGNDATVWDRVFVTAAARHRVCRYDRPGLGRSVPLVGARTGDALVSELRELLRQAGITPPYILVGASFGGLLAQLHARVHPEDVAAIVLVDSTHPGLDRRIEAILSPSQRSERRTALETNGEGLTFADLESINGEVERSGPFPSIPLAVLRHGQPFDPSPGWPNEAIETLWATLQKELAALSSTSQLVVASRSQHRIAQTEPELVNGAIDWALHPVGTIAVPSTPPVLGAGPLPKAGSIAGEVAFVRDGDLVVMNGDGLKQRVVISAKDTAIGGARISPDGTHIAFVRSSRMPPAPGQEPATELLTSTIEGRDASVVAHGPAIGGLTWSPDGATLAFAGHGEVMLVPSGGGTTTKVADGGCPLWSPDGARLAICQPNDEIGLVNRDGSGLIQITDAPGVDEARAWSPDGKRLAIYSERDGNGEVYVVGADGSSPTRITNSAGSQVVDAWLSDGSLVVASFPPDSEGTYWLLLDETGGNPRSIEQLNGAGEPIDWHQPKG